MLIWPRELTIEGSPADRVNIIEDYRKQIAESDLAKAFRQYRRKSSGE
jgi:hypothetical protein